MHQLQWREFSLPVQATLHSLSLNKPINYHSNEEKKTVLHTLLFSVVCIHVNVPYGKRLKTTLIDIFS